MHHPPSFNDGTSYMGADQTHMYTPYEDPATPHYYHDGQSASDGMYFPPPPTSATSLPPPPSSASPPMYFPQAWSNTHYRNEQSSTEVPQPGNYAYPPMTPQLPYNHMGGPYVNEYGPYHHQDTRFAVSGNEGTRSSVGHFEAKDVPKSKIGRRVLKGVAAVGVAILSIGVADAAFDAWGGGGDTTDMTPDDNVSDDAAFAGGQGTYDGTLNNFAAPVEPPNTYDGTFDNTATAPAGSPNDAGAAPGSMGGSVDDAGTPSIASQNLQIMNSMASYSPMLALSSLPAC